MRSGELEHRLFPRTAAGAAIGGVVGAGIGALVSVVTGYEDAGDLWMTMLGFFLFVGAVGGLLALFSAVAVNNAWDTTLVPAAGCSWILVAAEEPDVLDRAEDVLGKTGADHVGRVTPSGRPVRR